MKKLNDVIVFPPTVADDTVRSNGILLVISFLQIVRLKYSRSHQISMDVKERLSNVMYLVYIVWLTELSKGYLDIVITTKSLIFQRSRTDRLTYLPGFAIAAFPIFNQLKVV